MSLFCSLRGRNVAFENDLEDGSHQYSVDNACFISLGSCLQQRVWEHTWPSREISKELAPRDERDGQACSLRCLMSLMTQDGNVYGIYVTVVFFS